MFYCICYILTNYICFFSGLLKATISSALEFSTVNNSTSQKMSKNKANIKTF